MRFIARPIRRRVGTEISRDSSNRTSRSPRASSTCRANDRASRMRGLPAAALVPSAESNAGTDNPNKDDSASDRSIQNNGENSSNGGEAHGIGADPDSLFGAPTAAKLGNEGFEIAIEAPPVDHGAKGSGRAYVPPKVRTPLNLNQEPDEPVARAAVPAADRTTIKRVFER